MFPFRCQPAQARFTDACFLSPLSQSNDEGAVPQVKYNFVELSSLDQMEKDQTCGASFFCLLGSPPYLDADIRPRALHRRSRRR